MFHRIVLIHLTLKLEVEFCSLKHVAVFLNDKGKLCLKRSRTFNMILLNKLAEEIKLYRHTYFNEAIVHTKNVHYIGSENFSVLA